MNRGDKNAGSDETWDIGWNGFSILCYGTVQDDKVVVFLNSKFFCLLRCGFVLLFHVTNA